MADIGHFKVTEATEQTTTSATYVTHGTAAAASMTATNKYLVLVFGKHNSTDKDGVRLWSRMSHGATPTELASSLQQLETSSTSSSNRGNHYNWFTVFTQPGTAEDIYFQQLSENGSVTVSVQSLHMFVLDLSDLTTDQWKVATDTSGPTQHTTSMVSRVGLTWTPATASHDWLILGNAAITIDSAVVQYEIDLYDSTGSTVLALHNREGEDAGEVQQQALMGVLKNLPATSQTVQVRTRDDQTGTNDYDVAELFVLDLDAFAQHFIHDPGGTVNESAADTWDEVNTLTFTPDGAGDWLTLAGVAHEVSGSAERFDHRIQIGGVTKPTDWEDRNYGTSFDAGDKQYTLLGAMENLAASEQTVSVDAKFVANTSQVWRYPLLVAFSMALADAGPATQTLFPDYPTVAATAYDPTINAGAVDIDTDRPDIVATSYDPVVFALTPIDPDKPDIVATPHDPTITPGSATITPDYKQILAIELDPVLLAVSKIDPDKSDVTATPYNPDVVTGAATLLPDQSTVPTNPYDPELVGGDTLIDPDRSDVVATPHDPTVAGETPINVDLVNMTINVYDPVIPPPVPPEQYIGPDREDVTIVVYDPEVTNGVLFIFPDLATSELVAHGILVYDPDAPEGGMLTMHDRSQ